MRTSAFLFFILVSLTGATAQTIISGRVSCESGTLPGANVYLDGTYDGASTDTAGYFKFSTNVKGKVVLRAGFVGYETFMQEIELQGVSIKLDIKLSEKFNMLEAVTITAGTFEAGDRKQAVILSSLDMVTTAGANGDVYGALQNLPGTTVNGESGRLFVKGGDSEESQTYIDGALVHVPYNSTVPNVSTRGRFNPFMFSGTVFSTGGYSAEYGQALSSVLLLSTNDMPSEDQLDLSLLTVGAEIAGTKLWKKGAVTGSFSYNNLAPYMRIAPQNYDWQQPPVSSTAAISVRQKTGKNGMFKLYGTYGNSGFGLKQQDLNTDSSFIDYTLKNENYYINASWKSSLGSKWTAATSASCSKNVDVVDFDVNKLNKKLLGYDLKTTFTKTINPYVKLRFGGVYQSKQYSNVFTEESATYNQSFTNNQSAAFAEAELYTSQKLVFRTGARFEYSDYLGKAGFAPRISAAYKLNATSQFSAAYGWFYQNPSDDYLLYTSDLKMERADHYMFSYQSTSNGRTLRAEVYYKKYMHLAKSALQQQNTTSGFNNNGHGYAGGLDVFYRDKKTIKNGDYWISYSYLDTKRDYRTYPELSVPGFASTHNFSVVYKHWFGKLRSLAGVNFRYASPRVYNNPNTNVFNGEKMSSYKSLDVSWSFLYKQNVIFYAAVNNLPGFKQEFGRRYASFPDENGYYRSAAIESEAPRFFILACFVTLTSKGTANQLDKIE